MKLKKIPLQYPVKMRDTGEIVFVNSDNPLLCVLPKRLHYFTETSGPFRYFTVQGWRQAYDYGRLIGFTPGESIHID